MNRQERLINIIALIAIVPLAILGWIYVLRNGGARVALGAFLGGLVTLALYSILYRENPIYRFVEHVYLGLAAGYGVVITWTEVLKPYWYDPVFVQKAWLWLWVLPLAIMAYFVFSKRHGWISRIPLVILSGFAAGQYFQAYAQQYFPQIQNSFRSIRPGIVGTVPGTNLPAPGSVTPAGAVNNLIFMVALLAVLSYFLFSFEQRHKGIRTVSQWGRWLMMIGFGAIFGSTIMTRFALLVDRVYFLLVEWLHVAKPI